MKQIRSTTCKGRMKAYLLEDTVWEEKKGMDCVTILGWALEL
jgi:hypothetical protein